MQGDTTNPSPLGIVGAQTRLIYPFYFARQNVSATAAALVGVRFAGRPVWELQDAASVANDFFTNETHDAALVNLFGPAGQGRYLRMPDQTANAMFGRRLELARAGSTQPLPFRLAPGCYAEVFLTPYGVGALCLTVMLDDQLLADAAAGLGPANTNHALMFNYLISQLQKGMEASIRVPHPRDDEAKWESIPPAERDKIPAPPAAAAALTERLNAPGGQYRLSELIDFFLEPLRQDDEFHAYSSQWNVYAVVRFGADVSFLSPDSRDQFIRVLAGLAQVEEHTHAGAVPGQPGTEHELLNKRHWAAVGCQGAAHLVADQAGDVAFNEERLQRSRDRYFVTFLTAYLQRLAIQRASDLIGDVMQSTAPGEFESCSGDFRRLLRDTIEFNALAYLPEISRRELLNRYYRLAQAGMQVSQAWERVNQNVATLDAACRTSQNEALARSQAEDTKISRGALEESLRLQGKVEWVEVFVIAVYAAEMFHIMGEVLHFHRDLVAGFTLGGSLLAMLVAYLFLRPDKHAPVRGLAAVVVGGLLLMGAYLGLGAYRFPREAGHSGPGEHAPTPGHPTASQPPAPGHAAGRQDPAPAAEPGHGDSPPPATSESAGDATGTAGDAVRPASGEAAE